MRKPADQPGVVDCVLLLGVICVSTLPYLAGLGFYSDDWSYQEALIRSSPDGLGTMVREMVGLDPHFLIRPTQLAFFVLGFKAFGRHPLPYHIVSSAALGLVVVLFYLVLKELRAGRRLAFAIALIFGLLPHYSTDRFWISSHQAAVCMAFALLGIFALLRSIRPEEEHTIKWLGLACAALALSLLSYEVSLGLTLASLGVIGWRKYFESGGAPKRNFKGLAGIVGTALLLLLVMLTKARMQSTIVYHHHLFTRLGELTRHTIVQALLFNMWTYGLHMPAVLASLYRQHALSGEAMAAAGIVACLVTAYLWRWMEPSDFPGRRVCLWLILVGFVLFGLGYMLFFPDPGIDFSTAGLANRVEIASALGAACTLVAIAGLGCSLLRNNVLRARAFSIVVGLACGVNCLAVSGIGFFWVDAASRQDAVLQSVAAHVHSLPPESVLLLDGFCRYSGPGVVLEGPWDTTAAMQLALNDFSISGDVLSSSLRFQDAAVEGTIYGQPSTPYPYGDRLFVYNIQRQALVALQSKEAAYDYMKAMNPGGDSGCPPAEEGKGAKIF